MPAPARLLLAIVASSLLIGWGTLTRGHEWGDDFAAYILQARSILDGTTGEFIQHNAFTIRESSFQIGPVAYPWGYPLMLTPALLARGVHPLALKTAGVLCFAGFLVCLYRMTMDRLPPPESLLLVALFAFSPVFTTFLDHVLSDIPLLFFLFLGLAWIERRKDGLGSALGVGAVIFLAFFVRTTGIVLLGSFLAWQAVRLHRHPERRRQILLDSVATVSSFLLLWLLASLAFPGGQASYFKPLEGFTSWTLRENRRYYFTLFGTFLGSGPIWSASYKVLVLLFLVGLWVRRRLDLHLALFFALYLALMLVWPMKQGIRFIFPLLPIFMYLAFQGARAVTGWLPEGRRKAGRAVCCGAWLLLAGIFVFQSGTLAWRNLRDGRTIEGPFDAPSSDLFRYVGTQTPPDSVVVFFKPRAMRLFASRDSVLVFNCQRLHLGDYVVVSKKAVVGQVPAARIGQCGLPLTSVFENQVFVVYALPRTGA